MRPSKHVAHRRDRDIDLKALWKKLGKEPPGPIVQDDRRAKDR